jgi:hypothetical protein
MPNHKRLEFFEKDVIEWNGEYQLNDFYKTLLDLHTNNPAVRGGDAAVTTYVVYTNADDNVLSFLRKNGKDEVLVFINLSEYTIDCNILDGKAAGYFKNIFTADVINLDENRQIEMKPWDYFVFERYQQAI